ncbi:hypothetical protein Tco_0106042 [Tanacetum coccineum]
MHTSRDNYLINTLRDSCSTRRISSYGAQLPKSMSSPEMWETKAYKTYLGYATGVTPPKKAQKFKKHASPKLSTVPASPEEPTRKSKRVKRPTKKSFNASKAGVVIRETHVKYLSKKKEKMIVEKRKGIDLLFEVALIEEAHATKMKPSVTNEGTGVKPGVLDVTEEESTKKRDSGDDNSQSDSEKGSDSEHETDENESGSESDQEENEEDVEDDEEEKDDNLVKTPSNSTDDEDETKSKDKTKGDEDEGMDYTTNQFDDDVDFTLNEPVTTNEGFIQKEGTNAEMTNVQQGNKNPKISQIIKDAHVTLSTIPHKTEVPVTSSSYSSDLASKFPNFLDIPHTDAKIVSPMDVHVHHEVPSNQTPTLFTVSILVITESLPIFSTVIP